MRTRSTLNHALTLVGGFLIRPCCVIPAALAAAGAGGAGAAAALAPYRPWLLAVAGLFFAGSFYWNFIRNRNRPGMVVWGVSALIAATLLLGPGLRTAPSSSTPKPKEVIAMAEDVNLNRAQIPVEGMACGACARRLTKALNRMSGVEQASVSFDTKRADVAYDPDRLDRAALEACIRETGFKPAQERQEG